MIANSGQASGTAPNRLRLTLLVSIVATLCFLAIWAGSNISRQSGWVEVPDGCDWFGFLRQARLFQENGPVGGLDTAIRDENSRYLIDKVKSLFPDRPALVGAVGPLCHWYQPGTDQLTLVSPPGTGLLYSFFAEGRQAHLAFFACTLAIFAMLAATIAAARNWTVPWIALVLGIALLRTTGLFVVHWSIAPCVPLLMAAGYLTVRLIEATERDDGGPWALLLGLTFGAAMTVRIPNLLLASGVSLVLVAVLLRGRWLYAIKLGVLSAIGSAIGFLPTLASNWINVGNPLSLPYGPGNTRAFAFDWETASTGASYYFYKHQTVGGLAIAGAVMLVAAFVLRRRLNLRAPRSIAFAGFLGLAATFLFFVFYLNRLPYLPVPGVIYGLSVAGFLFARSENLRAVAARSSADAIRRPTRFAIAGVAIAGLMIFAVAKSSQMPVSPNYAQPQTDVVFPERSLVWATLTGGFYYLYLDRQAGMLVGADLAAQDRIIDAVAADGVPQFVADDQLNKPLVERLQAAGRLERVGRAFDYDVYRLVNPG